MEKTLYLSSLEPDLAAALLVGCEHLDPAGRTTARDIPGMTRGGQCYAATSHDGAQVVYVVNVSNGVAWIDAAKGAGPVPWSETLLPIIEAQSKGLRSVGFQTARPGLVRKAERQGYRVAGWIMKKQIQP